MSSSRVMAAIIRNIIGFQGDLNFDQTKPDGTPRKILDVNRLAKLGWKATTGLEEGIRKAYEDFKKTFK